MTIEEFVAARPYLVSCGRPSTAAEIDRFEREFDFPVPLRIRAIWSQFGSGTLFETEDFFTPAVDLVTGESAFSLTQEMRRHGLSAERIVIYRGPGDLRSSIHPAKSIKPIMRIAFPPGAPTQALTIGFRRRSWQNTPAVTV